MEHESYGRRAWARHPIGAVPFSKAASWPSRGSAKLGSCGPMRVVLAEKPSVARELAAFLRASTRADGYIEGQGYQVTWAFGHLVTLKEPEDYDPARGERFHDKKFVNRAAMRLIADRSGHQRPPAKWGGDDRTLGISGALRAPVPCRC